jgi:phenylpropionate dioxygenase-like ring-hydroxylating dioxygenase large terminal subunit
VIPDLTQLTEFEAAGIHRFEKPAAGSWTASFGLDTDPVSFADCYDEEFYELEKEAVFRRSWLHMGRVEQLPRKGSYFTKELEFLGISVLVIRGMDGEIRAFHNVCSHRGNKLVWDEYPSRESNGNCRQLACKYHGWRFDLEGQIGYVHNAPEFFDLKAEELALPKINCEVWAGFVFINLEATPRQSLREFLTPSLARLESYPFDQMTETVVMDVEVKSNWKLLMDAFQELYHVPYVHSRMNNPGRSATGTDKVPFMVPAFTLHGKHRCLTSGGQYANFAVRRGRPLDELFNSTFYGPRMVPDVGPLGDGVNPARIDDWGLDSWHLYPNLSILQFCPNWYQTYEFWPLSASTFRFIWRHYFVPSKNASERLALEQTSLSVREFAIEDVGAVEAMQAALESRARDLYHLNDQEILVRHLHHHIQADVEAYRRELEGE